MVTVTSKDGQVFVGNVLEEDAGKIVLNMVGLEDRDCQVRYQITPNFQSFHDARGITQSLTG